MSKKIHPSTIKYILEQNILFERKAIDIHKDVSDSLAIGTVRQIIKRPFLYIEESIVKNIEKRKKGKMVCRECGRKASITNFIKLYGSPAAFPETNTEFEIKNLWAIIDCTIKKARHVAGGIDGGDGSREIALSIANLEKARTWMSKALKALGPEDFDEAKFILGTLKRFRFWLGSREKGGGKGGINRWLK